MNFIDFIKSTDGLDSALTFAIDHGLLPDRNPRTCVKCSTEGSLKWCKRSRNINLPYTFYCSVKGCRCTIAIGRNTIFNHINFALSQALRLIYFWLLRINVNETANQLQLKEVTVSEWFKNFKEVCAFVIINYTRAIGGPNSVVEVCEYKLSSQEEPQDLWIYTGVDRKTGHNFVIHVEDLDSESLWSILKNYILPGSLVVARNSEKLTELESESGIESLTFVDPKARPRMETDNHLDDMFDAMQEFICREVHTQDDKLKELLAYQFLYFNRDGFVNKPVSEIVIPFMNDVRQVYPGYEKVKHFDRWFY